MTHSVSFSGLLFCSSLAQLRQSSPPVLIPSEHPMLNNIDPYIEWKNVPAREQIHIVNGTLGIIPPIATSVTRCITWPL